MLFGDELHSMSGWILHLVCEVTKVFDEGVFTLMLHYYYNTYNTDSQWAHVYILETKKDFLYTKSSRKV